MFTFKVMLGKESEIRRYRTSLALEILCNKNKLMSMPLPTKNFPLKEFQSQHMVSPNLNSSRL